MEKLSRGVQMGWNDDIWQLLAGELQRHQGRICVHKLPAHTDIELAVQGRVPMYQLPGNALADAAAVPAAARQA
eukprot:10734485-Alexandrium_andersonii.AAC.1